MISVVITCYNKVEYIEQCIRSVMDQVHRDLEIIVVDDGSADGSLDVIRSLAKESGRICVVEMGRHGGGVAGARNVGLDLAGGEWMHFLDGDDWILPHHLERLWLRACNKAVDVPCSQYAWVTPDGRQWSPSLGPVVGGRMFELATTGCPVVIHGAIIRVELVKEVGGFTPGYEPCEDWDFWAKVARTGAQFDFVTDTVAPYRLSPASVQKRKLEALLANGYRIFEEGTKPDPRVIHPHPDFAGGYGRDRLAINKLFMWCYVASIAMGSGVDIKELPSCPPVPRLTDRDDFGLAQMVYLYVPFGLSRLPDVWQEVWPSWEQRVRAVFEALGSSMCYFEALVRAPWPEVQFEQAPRDWLEATLVEEDPWHYRDSPYELTKYGQTFELLPKHVCTAAEVGCAEGVFTEQLAHRCEFLDAFDISPTALARAKERCQAMPWVWFRLLDIYNEPLQDVYDLIVCSEVLYHVDRQEWLWDIAERFFRALKEDGDLVMAHARLVVDNEERPAFHWAACPFGVETITRVFSSRFSLVQEVVTPFYRVQRYRKNRSGGVEIRQGNYGEMSQELAASVVKEPGQYVPILAYHGFNDGRFYRQRWNMPFEHFESQMAYLAENGYQPITVERFLSGDVPERAVILTFDDAEKSFFTLVWPVLQKLGYPATVFVPVAMVGGFTDWPYGPQAKVLWPVLLRRLKGEGVCFGAHGLYHDEAMGSWAEATLCETMAAKVLLEDIVGPVDLWAYPYGLSDFRIQAIVKACGFRAAFECDDLLARKAGKYDGLMTLPRIPILGIDTLDDFEGKLG